MDVLFRFNVVNTAVSTITMEITDKLGRVGSSWHFCLFVWTLYFGIAEIKEDLLRPGPASAAMFIGSSLYLVFAEYTEKIFKFDFLKVLANLCMYISLPFVAVHYVWNPLNKGTSCIINKFVGECNDSWTYTVSTFLALFFTILLIVYQRRKRDSSEKEAKPQTTSSLPVQRRQSARILARKQKRNTPVKRT